MWVVRLRGNVIAHVNIKAHISLGFKSALPALHKLELFWILFHYVLWQHDKLTLRRSIGTTSSSTAKFLADYITAHYVTYA